MLLTRSLFLVITALFLVSGCGNTRDETKEVVAVAKIEWFDGAVAAAFTEAQESDTPVFLYWGAVWCPPCQEIKHTVFKSQEFINLTKLFIPVYLDGDTDQAQAQGEKFGVKGYPTMIVFNPQGEEITRIPGGIDISRYNSVLDISLNKMRPTSMLVKLALDNPDDLQASDFTQLAYYSWGQDFSSLPEEVDAAGLFYKLSGLAPDNESRARFYMSYLVSLEEQNKPVEEGEDPPVLSIAAGDSAARRLTEILNSDTLLIACWDSLAYYADDLMALPLFDEAESETIASLWGERVFALRNSPSLSKAEKLAGWLPKLHFYLKANEKLSDELEASLVAELVATDQATPDSYERQSVINQMSYIYRQAKLLDAAKVLLMAELDKSASPYYFMSGLASFAEKDENFEEAVSWRRKAYETSSGEATRFQWGANYVRSIIRMTPEDGDLITGQAVALLEEFQKTNEVFAGRNFKILRGLNKELIAWQESQQMTELAFEARVRTMCDGQDEGSVEAANCESLFIIEEPIAQAS